MARRRLPWLGVIASLLMAWCALDACGGTASRRDLPNLIVVTLDTTRADHLGLYGYFRETSPELDAFSQRAIVFERAIAPMATTLPTHLSLFTATHPLEHGVLANARQGGRRFEPSPALRPLAVACREAGYRTAAFVSGVPLKRGSGIEAGFDDFDDTIEMGTIHRRAHLTTNAALEWLEEASEAPFLLWVHYFDAHWKLKAPERIGRLFEVDPALEAWLAERGIPERTVRLDTEETSTHALHNLYDAELRFQDEQLGRLLAALQDRSDWARSAVLIVGDHGEGLSQHAHAAHGGTWDEQLRVPLLMRIPGEAPRRETGLMSVVDVLPTFLGLLRVPELSGRLDQATGRDALSERSQPQVLSQDGARHADETGYRYALTTPRWKYVHVEADGERVQELLFDLESDPFELRDVAAANPALVAELRERLASELDARRDLGRQLRASEPAESPPDPRLAEQLRELGYVVEDDAPAAP